MRFCLAWTQTAHRRKRTAEVTPRRRIMQGQSKRFHSAQRFNVGAAVSLGRFPGFARRFRKFPPSAPVCDETDQLFASSSQQSSKRNIGRTLGGIRRYRLLGFVVASVPLPAATACL